MGEDEAEEGGDDEETLHSRRKNKEQFKIFGTRERDEKRYSLQAAQWQLWFKPSNYKSVDYLSTISDTCFRDASTWFSVFTMCQPSPVGENWDNLRRRYPVRSIFLLRNTNNLVTLGANDTSVSDKSFPLKVRSSAFHVFVFQTFNAPINVSWAFFNTWLGVRYDLSHDSLRS